MVRLIPDIASGLFTSVTAASAQFADLDPTKRLWIFSSTTDCFLKQAPSGSITAAAASGNMAVKAGDEVILDSRLGVKVAVIRQSADGNATIVPVSYTER